MDNSPDVRGHPGIARRRPVRSFHDWAATVRRQPPAYPQTGAGCPPREAAASYPAAGVIPAVHAITVTAIHTYTDRYLNVSPVTTAWIAGMDFRNSPRKCLTAACGCYILRAWTDGGAAPATIGGATMATMTAVATTSNGEREYHYHEVRGGLTAKRPAFAEVDISQNPPRTIRTWCDFCSPHTRG